MTKGNKTVDDTCQCKSSEIREGNLSENGKSTKILEGNFPANTESQENNGNNVYNINIADINIADYVQNLPDDVRYKIAGFIGTGIVDQQLIDTENIEHYLVVSRFSNPLKSACEAKLLATLTPENSLGYLNIAERFNLEALRIQANQLYNQIFLTNNNEALPPQRCTKNKSYTTYNALFTCDTSSKKRTVSVVVLNKEQEIKCYKTVKKGKKISNQFRCCCIQDGENNPPYVYWSFGSSFCRYDPMLNKYKKLTPLQMSRSNFSLVAYGDTCFAIGGERFGQPVHQIEKYNTKTKRWGVVATIPDNCRMTYSTCVKFHNLIYIFSAAQNNANCNTQTAVCVFEPATQRVTLKSEMPMSFNNITGCLTGDHIYLASDNGEFIRYFPRNDTYETLCKQPSTCKNFGMYEENGDIFLAGGMNEDGKCNNIIRKFCTISGRWQRHDKKLPDCFCVNGSCAMKIPRICTIVPFYESNVFEKPCK